MKFLNNILCDLMEYKNLVSSLNEDEFPIAVTGLADIHKAHIVCSLCRDLSKKAFIITANDNESERLAGDLLSMGIKAVLYNTRDFCFRDLEGTSKEYEYKRIKTISKVIAGDFDVLISSIEASLEYTMPAKNFINKKFKLSVGKEMPLSKVTEHLISSGYERYSKVEGLGQFSVRGGIIDFFSPSSDFPTRIEFFGDSIESICEFDLLSQRRIKNLIETELVACNEVIIDDPDLICSKIKDIAKNINIKNPNAFEVLMSEADKVKERVKLNSIDKFIEIIYGKVGTIFDYIPKDIPIFVSETANVKKSIEVATSVWKEDLNIYLSDGTLCSGLDSYMKDTVYLIDQLSNSKCIYMDMFVHSNYSINPRKIIEFNAHKLPTWRGEIKTLSEDVKRIVSEDNSVVILCGNERFAAAVCNDLQNSGINSRFLSNPQEILKGEAVVTLGSLSSGFRYEGSRIYVISKGKYNPKKKRNKVKNKEIFDLSDLKEGNYVVHSEYGIGIFSGVHSIRMNGTSKDYIKIMYEKGDILYVPVTQMDMVSKYIGTKDDIKLKLNKLGGGNWQKIKKRVREEVKDIAKELVKIYSERMHAPGVAFSEDDEWQKNFDSRFEYNETDDQLRSINEIKKDMQRKAPMDRLLCGDVGFGKTEVALRAAFKCLADGKQCAMLVPTTILAWQHFQTISKRFSGFPFKIELLSRFKTQKQQKRIIKGLKNGDIEFIVGTHRLVQEDVKFKDLGLVIIDEEQRFGVAHKEKFKALAKNVDVLTLSATPIPRTLNMAMSGIRDMSTLDEAPQDRLPVQTYVMEYDINIILDAIRKEIRRGGQIYYLHNRIESIEQTAGAISIRIPEANVGVAHGRMSESELSEVWRKMLEQEINVLVCTTIIETGVDVPNANTLIIDNADCMGLSQLHQLRGRVGRSSRRAYAYFTFRKNKVLSEIAQKRLSAIRDFTEFGAGFKIAMRDLELRGAGNIIGAKQHGNIESVGYNMYLNLLEEAVKEEKGEKVETHEIECLIDINEDANIPEYYITSLGQRLNMYRRISDIRKRDDIDDIIDELKDRFGSIPCQVINLINIAFIRSIAFEHGVYEIKQRDNLIFVYQHKLDMKYIKDIIRQMKGKISVNAGDKPYLVLKLSEDDKPIRALNKVFNIEF